MLQRLCVVIVMGTLLGCGHTSEVFLSPQMDNAPLRRVNMEVRNRTVELVLQDGRSFVAQITRISPDSTFWHAKESKVSEAVRTAEISRISFKNRKKGVVEGLMMGALILLPTAILSNSLSDDESSDSRASVVLNGGVAGVV
ncbi:MAG: hypothetical protein O2954_05360, partial [bacterium]|nr:hypothetical protein [bacterium]